MRSQGPWHEAGQQQKSKPETTKVKKKKAKVRQGSIYRERVTTPLKSL